LIILAILAALMSLFHDLRQAATACEEPLPTDGVQPINYHTFRHIKPGMKRETVIALLGEPTTSSIGRFTAGWIEDATWKANNCAIHVELSIQEFAFREPAKGTQEHGHLVVKSATVSAKQYIQDKTPLLDRVRGWLGLDR
jgi:hypothetical protein